MQHGVSDGDTNPAFLPRRKANPRLSELHRHSRPDAAGASGRWAVVGVQTLIQGNAAGFAGFVSSEDYTVMPRIIRKRFGNGNIGFLDFPGRKRTGEFAVGFGGSGKEQDSRSGLVQAMNLPNPTVFRGCPG